MFRLSRLESPIQEIIFVITLALTTSLLLGGGFYLFLHPETLPVITGKVGVWFFGFLYSYLGLASLLLGIGLFLIGNYLLPRSATPRDVWKLAPNVIMQLLIQVLVIVMIASLLSVIQLYQGWGLNERLAYGFGGWVGMLIGGNLFKFFGLFGSLAFIISFSVVVGIASGLFEFLNVTLWLREKSISLSKGTLGLSQMLLKKAAIVGEFSTRGIKNYYRKSYRRGADITAFLKRSGEESEISDSNIESSHSSNDYQIDVSDQTGFNLDSLIDDSALEEQKENTEEDVEDNKKVHFKITQAEPSKAVPLVKKSKKKTTAKTKTPKPEDETKQDIKEAEKVEEIKENKDELVVKKYSKRYVKPEANLLEKSKSKPSLSKTEVEELSRYLEDRLVAFSIKGKIVAAHQGVTLTLFEFLPDAGVKLSKIAGLGNDLALVLGAPSIRIMTPIPGKTTVGIEVPNKEAAALFQGDLLPALSKAKHALPIALGKNVYNETVINDIASMPHMLVSGTTGSGKSVFINTLISGLLYTKSPKELRFIMVDPKMIELSPYNGIPHLLKPVITDVTEAKDALKWAEQEMDKRYQQFADLGSRNIDSFNEKIKTSSKETIERQAGKKLDWEFMPMPYIVVVVDEMADLMLTQGKEVEIPITRIAQKARAAGIHLILATQRPSSEIVTGLIKTNFPTRISFKVSSSIDSRTILDTSGAEKLLGKGDMLFMANGKNIERIQGAFISEEEVKKIVRSISKS